jgi:hypothetical protein
MAKAAGLILAIVVIAGCGKASSGAASAISSPSASTPTPTPSVSTPTVSTPTPSSPPPSPSPSTRPLLPAQASPSAQPTPTPTPSPVATPPGPGTWQRTFLMSSPRADFTATLLQNGKVLLAGGESSATANTPTVDLFDPVTNSITPAAPMANARSGHTATLLPNGKVLVVGGSARGPMPGSSYPGVASLNTAEIYDPATNSWAAAASMASARTHHAAVLLTNGKVLVTGGSGNWSNPAGASNPTGAEIYDPPTNTWTSIGSIAPDTRPNSPTATLLKDGRVMIAGGSDSTTEPVAADVQLYDSSQSVIGYAHAIPPAGGRNGATATLLRDGTVLIVGGQHSTSPAGAQSSTDIYDPANDSFSAGPPTNVGHCNHTATLLQNGLLLVAGGQCGTSDSIAVSELYDPITRKWWPAGQFGDPRGHFVAVLLNDGRVLAAGGIFPGGTRASDTEIYTPA